ncbi:MAG: MFS transporter, partial [Streptomyces sp.]|nr:MFS transporter [Streptomyces sp.]
RAARLVATMASIGAAGPVFALGGYPVVGAASVLACVLAAVVATRLPEHRAGRETGADGWWVVLRTGLGEARGNRSVRGALLLIPAVAAVWGALDEYTPLLARDTGVAEATVPYLILLVWTLVTVATLLSGPAERLGTTGMAWLLAGSALALAVGAALRTPAGIALVGLAFGGFQLAEVLADVRLQHRIDDARRATLTSVASLGTELVTVLTFAAYALLGARADHSTVFVILSVPYLVTALALGCRRNESPPEPPRAQ